MGATERWLEASPEGVLLVEENDGWAYLRKGPERSRTPVVITKVEDPRAASSWGHVHYGLTMTERPRSPTVRTENQHSRAGTTRPYPCSTYSKVYFFSSFDSKRSVSI
jgi:hypothetical protein